MSDVIKRGLAVAGGDDDFRVSCKTLKDVPDQFGRIVFSRQVGQKKVRHVLGAVRQEEFKRLFVRQVPVRASDAPLQMERVTAGLQHPFVVVRFQKSGVALAEVPDHVFARGADVGEDADAHVATLNHKALRITGIVQLGKSGN